MSSTIQRLVAACLLGGAVTAAAACGTGEVRLPPVRRLVIHTGARLAPTQERVREIDNWIREQWDSISRDPAFMIITTPEEGPVYPWEDLELVHSEGQDTASVGFQGPQGVNIAGRRAFVIYAHLQLMASLNRLERWLPEAEDAGEFELEQAILARTAEAWLYQRAVYDAAPNAILDELMFVAEHGYLDAFILMARPGEFVVARREWVAENPGRSDAYVAWFRQTFQRDPPGLRGASGGA